MSTPAPARAAADIAASPRPARARVRRGVAASIAPLVLAACAQLPYRPVPQPVPPQIHAVVFDIDGTLTPAVPAFFQARPDAARVVQAYADKGYAIVYLSTRSRWLSAGVPAWLERKGFPQGSVHVAQSAGERDRPDLYKAAVLREFQARGWVVDYAFGDSSTDFAAYAAAGIPVERVFALRRRGHAACQPGVVAACLGGWSGHLDDVATLVPSVPPAAAGVPPTR